MFEGASLANPDVGGWSTANVEDMSSLFANAPSASPNVSSWNMRKVKTIDHMFDGASAASPNVQSWQPVSLRSMKYAFRGSNAANLDLSQWNNRSIEADGAFDSIAALQTLHFKNLRNVTLKSAAQYSVNHIKDEQKTPIQSTQHAYAFEDNEEYEITLNKDFALLPKNSKWTTKPPRHAEQF